MQHAMRYEGAYERNFHALRPNASEYEGDDGSTRRMAPWPETATGVQYGFMEQAGKRFVAVRVRFGADEVLLRNPVRLDPARHMGGKRFSAEPILLSDAAAGSLLGDILDANREQQKELTAMRDQIRQALKVERAR